MSKTSNEYRATARLDEDTSKRLQKASEKIGISTSDLVRLAIKKSLPEFEAGHLSGLSGFKKAA